MTLQFITGAQWQISAKANTLSDIDTDILILGDPARGPPELFVIPEIKRLEPGGDIIVSCQNPLWFLPRGGRTGGHDPRQLSLVPLDPVYMVGKNYGTEQANYKLQTAQLALHGHPDRNGQHWSKYHRGLQCRVAQIMGLEASKWEGHWARDVGSFYAEY